MRRLGLLFQIVFAIWMGLLAAPSFAADADLTTPEGAVAAYLAAVARQDFNAIIATTAADHMSKGFDFVAHVEWMGVLGPSFPGPSSSPLFVDINKAAFTAETAWRVRFLAYGLMTTSPILDGKIDEMDAAGAADFVSAVRADRLAGLALVKVGIPNPAEMLSVRYQAHANKFAKIYGADTMTERMALVSFEGLYFTVGFTLLRYGDEWTVQYQSSAMGGTSSTGIPKRVTPEEFEKIIR